MSKKFKVYAKSINYFYVVVKADAADRAVELAREIDAGEFILDGHDWELDPQYLPPEEITTPKRDE